MTALITRLRTATLDDCTAIYNVHRLAVRCTCLNSYNTTIMQAWLELLNLESYQSALVIPHKALWVIEYKNRISGFFLLDFQAAQLDALYVHPFLYGHGLGTALLQRAEKLCVQADLSILSLYTSPNSVSFYALNGYQSLGEAVMPLNQRVSADCMLMRKFL